jgi:cytochrome c peroxidase
MHRKPKTPAPPYRNPGEGAAEIQHSSAVAHRFHQPCSRRLINNQFASNFIRVPRYKVQISYFSNPVVVNGVTYDQYQTTDPGVGWISGKCNDLGKFKVSSLRGIGARPAFFHGGEAATMRDVVVFYNNRFNMNLSAQDIQDLVNFLNAQ